MGVFPCAQEWWFWVSFFLFSPYFLLPVKNCFGVGSEPLAPEEHFSGYHDTDQVPLFISDNSTF